MIDNEKNPVHEIKSSRNKTDQARDPNATPRLPDADTIHVPHTEAPRIQISPADLENLDAASPNDPDAEPLRIEIPASDHSSPAELSDAEIPHPSEASLSYSSSIPGDPLAVAPTSPSIPRKIIPEDLRISWSWPHLFVFLFFAVASLFVVQLGLVFYVSATQHLSGKQVQQVFESKPQFLIGTNLLWYALLFLFLYVTLAVLRGLPFWHSLGWKKLNPTPTAGTGRPWMYFLAGCGLAIFVALATYDMKNTEHLPIQEIFKSRTGALLLMGMAVLVAPLVEETVFRGYLYPLFAKSLGIIPGIVVTGFLFGLMHGAQLGWTWRLVLLLSFVGIIFTFARARSGTVVASFLLHLGYNSMIAVSAIIATKGFQHLPIKP
jgi:membrane protease YdiL (CAAX protease family)